MGQERLRSVRILLWLVDHVVDEWTAAELAGRLTEEDLAALLELADEAGHPCLTLLRCASAALRAHTPQT